MSNTKELKENELKNVYGGLTKEEVEEQLFKPGDWIDNITGYSYKIIKVISIDYNEIGNSEYEIEVYFLKDQYEYNDTRKHSQLAVYTKR